MVIMLSCPAVVGFLHGIIAINQYLSTFLMKIPSLLGIESVLHSVVRVHSSMFTLHDHGGWDNIFHPSG